MGPIWNGEYCELPVQLSAAVRIICVKCVIYLIFARHHLKKKKKKKKPYNNINIWRYRHKGGYLCKYSQRQACSYRLLFSPDITSRDSVVVNLLSQPPTQIVHSITLQYTWYTAIVLALTCAFNTGRVGEAEKAKYDPERVIPSNHLLRT